MAVAVALSVVGALGHQAHVVDVLAAVALDQYMSAGRGVAGESLHAVGVAVAVRGAADGAALDPQVVAEEAHPVTVAAVGAGDGVVPYGDVVTGDLDTGCLGSGDPVVLHGHVDRRDGDAVHGTATTVVHDRVCGGAAVGDEEPGVRGGRGGERVRRGHAHGRRGGEQGGGPERTS
ncbi:hypothetical protein AB0E10_09395 [Streptomyces sp. NPDC048045]|uniref:hypothetical protein n=1 Tax=Streptomyces sp. NPDC048045 TaxID=3154710 RepID=UPI003419AFE4